MTREKQIFVARFLLRFLLLSFFCLAFFVVYGGKLGVIIHSAPTALMTSFIGLFFLLTKGKYPNDWSSLSEVSEFRSLCWKTMWALNSVIFFGHLIVTMGRMNDGNEAIGLSVAGGLSGVLANSIFYLALILSPLRDQKQNEEEATQGKKLVSKIFGGGMFWTGILFWFVVSLSLTMNAYQWISGKSAQNDLKSKAYEVAAEKASRIKEEYIAKNCKDMPWEEFYSKKEEIEKEELRKLKVQELNK